MNSPSLAAEDLRTCAFVSLIWPLRSRRQRLRKLRPTRLSLRANQLTGEGDLCLCRPFSGAFCLAFRPSKIPAFLRLDTRHGSLQIGSLAPISGQGEPSGHQSPGSNVMQDSDFPWEITVRFFAGAKILPSPLVRRAAKQSDFFSPQNTYLVSPTNKNVSTQHTRHRSLRVGYFHRGKIAFHGAPRSVWFQEQNRDV